MLAFYFHAEDAVLPETESDFYRHFTISTVLRTIGRRDGRVSFSLRSFRELPPTDRDIFYKVCKLAFDATVEKKQVFTSSDLKAIDDSEGGLGLVVIDKYLNRYGLDQSYTFLHLKFQEYLSAVHIMNLNESEQRDVVNRNYEEPHLSVVWKFLCGMIDFKKEIAMEIFKKLMESSNSTLFKVQCSHESHKDSASSAELALPCTYVITSVDGCIEFSCENLSRPDCAAIGYVIKNADYDQCVTVGFDKCNLNPRGAVAFFEQVRDCKVSLKITE